MTDQIKTHILLGCTQGAAGGSAVKWGWEPAALRVRGRSAFIDAEGDLVVVSSSTEDLRGITPDTKVYLGHAWAFAYGATRPPDALRAHVARGGRVLVDNWKNGVMTGFTPPPYEI